MGNMINLQYKASNYEQTEMLLRLVVDDDYRNEHSAYFEQGLLEAIASQDVLFLEIIKNAPNAVSCRNTCYQGVTVICDTKTVDLPPCTCDVGMTITCPSPPPPRCGDLSCFVDY